MPILFVANDPEAKHGIAPRSITPTRRRSSRRADFDLGTMPRVKRYPPDSDEFLAWQCREGLLRALSTWESIAGPLSAWQGRSRSRLRVRVNAGADRNAYYARGELGFHSDTNADGRLRRFAASVDVVAHEAGHAFLDAIRPDLFDTPYLETNAFHEAFGDCIAILTSLADAGVRRTLLERDPLLSRANFVETLMESLANATRDVSRDDNAAVPRRGKNRYRWTLPTALPDDGGPGALINEDHSFGQVFVGCFYDMLRNVFRAARRRNAAALARAAKVAGTLLVRAAAKAPITPRFFQAIGAAMSLEDAALHGGAHHEAIRLAFRAHGVLLGPVAEVAPRATLRGGVPKRVRGRAPVIAKATIEDLRSRMHIPAQAPMRVRSYELGGRRVAEASHLRPVALRGLSRRLANVVALGPEPALIGSARNSAAVLGALPDARTTRDEVRSFVAGLVRRGAIAFDASQASRAKRARSAVRSQGTVTHVVVERRGAKVLKRLRFSCGCRAR